MCLLPFVLCSAESEKIFFNKFPIDYISKDIEMLTLENGLRVFSIHTDTHHESTVHIVVYAFPRNVVRHNPIIAEILYSILSCRTRKYDNISSTFNKFSVLYGSHLSAKANVFYALSPSDNLHHVMSIESDRMMKIQLSEEEVKNEKKRYKDHVYHNLSRDQVLTNNMLDGYLFQGHERVKRDVDDIGIEDFIYFHQNYYTPENARIIVISSMEHQEVFDMARDYYASIPNYVQDVISEEKTDDIVYNTKTVITLDAEYGLEKLKFLYPIPNLSSDTLLPCLVMYHALLNGDYGMIYRSLGLQKHLVHSVESSLESILDDEYVMITLTLEHGVDLEHVLLEYKRVIEQLISNGFDAQDITRALSMMRLSFFEDNTGLTNKAILYTHLVNIGLKEFTDYSKIRNIIYNLTVDDINTVFYQIFSPGPLVQGVLRIP
ncbi:MAG: insulinase family protein [Candidatus Xenolissoclinum pacificiensis L6]|uniref:Insulinase family protein n=1 Tax=Candidatus Xenolissoclinum pacificiensis L6 TaxID=1401685 RepID=W2UZE6_9RICK|nr:MAG: insulinase family protein [Candidatus Xenolissoclinum pacificiensis L6]